MARAATRTSAEGVYRKTELKNGLRVVTETLPGVRSLSLGVWVDVGSRCEAPEESGLSHFIEHLVFKGTRNRSPREIAASLESVGGSLNAFTTREHTCFTARVLREHLNAAVDVLADITCFATLSQVNMDRERQVIGEEIKESLDNPSDHIYDLFATTHWDSHPLGQPVMGTAQTIRSVTRRQLLAFRERHYRTGAVVVAASGSISHDRLVGLIKRRFRLATGDRPTALPARRVDGPRICLRPDDHKQTQFCLGFTSLPFGHPRRMALMVLSAYLGGGMSSVLFQKIREQRGLAYSVYTFNDFYRDAGVFGVYLGTDRKHLREAFDLIMKECRRLQRQTLSPDAFRKVRQQMKGQFTIGMESTSMRMHRLGRQELMTGSYQTLAETLAEIDRVKPSQVRELAEEMIDLKRISVAVLGPANRRLFDDLSRPR